MPSLPRPTTLTKATHRAIAAARGHNTASLLITGQRAVSSIANTTSPVPTHNHRSKYAVKSVLSTLSTERSPGPGTLSRSYSTADPEMYTASFAFFEALWEAGVTHCFVNLGSDHPSIIEAMVKGQREAKGNFPKIITCPNEVQYPISVSIALLTLRKDGRHVYG